MKEVAAAAAVILQDNRVLAVKRKNPDNSAPNGSKPEKDNPNKSNPDGKEKEAYAFPGGTIAPGETGEDAAIRAVKEELGLSVEVLDLYTEIEHRYPAYLLTTEVYLCVQDEEDEDEETGNEQTVKGQTGEEQTVEEQTAENQTGNEQGPVPAWNLPAGTKVRFLSYEELDSVKWLAADKKIVKELKEDWPGK